MPKIDSGEFSVAEKDAGGGAGTFTHAFRKPFAYMGKEYDKLQFDWEGLTGRDSLAIEAELQAMGVLVAAPAFSAPYIVRMAARACTETIGADAFELMPLADFNKIRGAARSFLLASE
jgi:hypothetical protein